jgi:hypothetical protein
MSRWGDIAAWRGPTRNQGGPMVEVRGVLLHIAEGYYEGTIAWQRNPAVEVSSHFIGGRSSGRAQLVDTDTTAWTQKAGNGHWLSVEFEGFTPGHRLHRPGWESLSSYQIEFAAAVLARAHKVYGVPLQIATSPTGRGLGHHSMGPDWGHRDCPGPAIIGQKGVIVERARAIALPAPPITHTGGKRMFVIKVKGDATCYISDGQTRRPLVGTTGVDVLAALKAAGAGAAPDVADLAQLTAVAGPERTPGR